MNSTTNKMTSIQEPKDTSIVNNIKDFLKQKFPDSVLVPQMDKHPKKAHAGLAAKQIRKNVGSGTHKEWGILLGKDLLCIDFDDEEKHAAPGIHHSCGLRERN